MTRYLCVFPLLLLQLVSISRKELKPLSNTPAFVAAAQGTLLGLLPWVPVEFMFMGTTRLSQMQKVLNWLSFAGTAER